MLDLTLFALAMNPSETFYSNQRLEQFLASNRSSSPRQIIGDLVNDVRTFAAGASQSDDITGLALQYVGAPEATGEILEIKLKNSLSELSRVSQSLNEFGVRNHLSPRVLHDLNLALEEILTNVISYGYADDREHEIRVRLSAQSGEVRIEVEDDGQPFNPLEAPEPDTAKSVEEGTISGLGIHLVRKVMDGLEYERQGNRNLLIMKKKTEKA